MYAIRMRSRERQRLQIADGVNVRFARAAREAVPGRTEPDGDRPGSTRSGVCRRCRPIMPRPACKRPVKA